MKESAFLNIKQKVRHPIVPSSPNHLLVILLEAKKNIWWDLNCPFMWGVGGSYYLRVPKWRRGTL